MRKIKLKVLSERQRRINKLLNEAKGGAKLSLPPLPSFEYTVLKKVQKLAQSPAFSNSLSSVVENNKNKNFNNFDEAYEAIKGELLPLTTELTAKAIELTINEANLTGTRRVRIKTSDSVSENKTKNIKIIVENKKQLLNEAAITAALALGAAALLAAGGVIIFSNPRKQRDLAQLGRASGELISSVSASFTAGTATLVATFVMQLEGIRILQPAPVPVDLPRAKDEPAPAPPPEPPVGGGGEPPKGPSLRDLLNALKRKAAEYCIGNMGQDASTIFEGILKIVQKMPGALAGDAAGADAVATTQRQIRIQGGRDVGKGLKGILKHLGSLKGVICQAIMAYAAGLAIDVVERQMNKAIDNDLELEGEWLAWSRTVGYKASGGIFWNAIFMTADLLLSSAFDIELSKNIEDIARAVGVLPKNSRLEAFILKFYYYAAVTSGLIGSGADHLMTKEELENTINSAATKKMTNARDITAKMVEAVLKKLVVDYNKAISNLKTSGVKNRNARLQALIEKNKKIATFFNNAAKKIDPKKTQQWGSLVGFDSKKVAEELQKQLITYGKEFNETAKRLQAIKTGDVKDDGSFYKNLKTIDINNKKIEDIINQIRGIKATTKPEIPSSTTLPDDDEGVDFN